jgi:small conductance mechanosensitive channel
LRDIVSFFRDIDPETRAMVVQALRITAILLLAWILQAVAARLIRLFRGYMARRTGADEIGRVETLARVFRNAAAIVIVVLAGTLVLGELGVSIAPILATAGVAGIAIGFGAQSLIKDYFNGFFLLLDDQVRQGDVVQVAGVGGLVEEVTLRYVRLRDLEGHVHFVPNGEIKLVTNRTRVYATPVVDVPISFAADADRVTQIARETAAALRADSQWSARIAADLEVIGMDRWSESFAVLRVRFKVVPPIEQWNVKREYLKRLKKAFDEQGIRIPYPQLTLHAPLLEKTPESRA